MRDAEPRIDDSQHRATVFSCYRHPDRPTFVRVLDRVAEQIDHDLNQPCFVASNQHGLRRERGRQLMPSRGNHLARRLDRFGDDATHVEDLDAQIDAARGNPGDVEQILEQAGDVAHLSVDDTLGLLRDVVFGASTAQQIHSRSNWCEWIAQLVTQHRQELVLLLCDVRERSRMLADGRVGEFCAA